MSKQKMMKDILPFVGLLVIMCVIIYAASIWPEITLVTIMCVGLCPVAYHIFYNIFLWVVAMWHKIKNN